MRIFNLILLLKAFTYTVDLSKRIEIYKYAEKVKSNVGHVDVLISNAGVANGKRFFESDDDENMFVMDVNTNALFFVSFASTDKLIF